MNSHRAGPLVLCFQTAAQNRYLHPQGKELFQQCFVVCALRKFTRFARMEDLGGFYSPNELGFEWLVVKDGSSDQASVGNVRPEGWRAELADSMCLCPVPAKLHRGTGTSKTF